MFISMSYWIAKIKYTEIRTIKDAVNLQFIIKYIHFHLHIVLLILILCDLNQCYRLIWNSYFATCPSRASALLTLDDGKLGSICEAWCNHIEYTISAMAVIVSLGHSQHLTFHIEECYSVFSDEPCNKANWYSRLNITRLLVPWNKFPSDISRSSSSSGRSSSIDISIGIGIGISISISIVCLGPFLYVSPNKIFHVTSYSHDTWLVQDNVHW